MDLEDPRYAYMFGFLQADGHLAAGPGRKGRLSVEINVRDIAILREFQRLTPYHSSITERVRSTNFSGEPPLGHLDALRPGSQDHDQPAGPALRAEVEAESIHHVWSSPAATTCAASSTPTAPSARRARDLPFVSLATASAAVGAYLCRYAKKRHRRRPSDQA